jgi:hypothetical protein
VHESRPRRLWSHRSWGKLSTQFQGPPLPAPLYSELLLLAEPANAACRVNALCFFAPLMAVPAPGLRCDGRSIWTKVNVKTGKYGIRRSLGFLLQGLRKYNSWAVFFFLYSDRCYSNVFNYIPFSSSSAPVAATFSFIYPRSLEI